MRRLVLAVVAAVILVPATDALAAWEPDQDLAIINRWHTKKLEKEQAKFESKTAGLQEEIDLLTLLGDLDGAAVLQAILDEEQAKYDQKLATIARQLAKKMEQHDKRVQKQIEREARKAAKAAEKDPEPDLDPDPAP